VEELTTPTLSVEWEPTNACSAVARACHYCLSLKIASCRQRLPSSRPIAAGRAYLLNKKEVVTFGIVVTEALFLISKPFCILVNLVVTHSFTSTRYAMRLNLENKETETDYRIRLANDSRV